MTVLVSACPVCWSQIGPEIDQHAGQAGGPADRAD